MSNLALLYITNSSIEEAKKLARHLLEKRLIGCANIYPIDSMYWWDGKIVEDGEAVLIAKCTPETVDQARTEVLAVHPYDTPCVLRLDADANEKYFQWIASEATLVDSSHNS
ncbi:MAG TPA: divalent-cation tolerance protein CutA [bacterium]|nr:divalent-cation tolerance protein CutA [bacterium]